MSAETVVPGPDDAAPQAGFGLVRRGYDPQEVDAHVTWLEEQLRQSEEQRFSAETAARAAQSASGTPEPVSLATRTDWPDLGGRIAQIFQLAEEEAQVVRAQRTSDVDQRLAEASRLHEEAEELHASKIRSAEQQAGEIVQNALAQADRIVRDARQTASQEESQSQLRLAELARQRTRVHGQLTRLRDEIVGSLAPLEAETAQETPAAGRTAAKGAPSRPAPVASLRTPPNASGEAAPATNGTAKS